jgi:hypothetical protein
LKISQTTGASISYIDKALKGKIEDNKGVIAEAYRLANEELERQTKDANELAVLKEKLNKNLQ